MLTIRRFEEKIVPLLNNEIECPVHLYTGQEAIAAGICASLDKEDYVFSTHRSHGHYIAKGGDMKTLMAEMYGKVIGCSKGRGGSMHLASPEVGLLGSPAIVAGSIPLAIGTALSSKIQRSDSISIVFFGDGATNEGVFYESLSFAALKKLPVIFVCENNLYATHMSISASLSDTRIYRKATVFDVPGVRINGNDVVKVYLTARDLVDAARGGKGPALIECLTYRWRGHVGSSYDIGDKLRTHEEVDHWMKKCPIKAFEKLLIKHGILSKSEKPQIYDSVDHEIAEALAYAREAPYPDPADFSSGVFKI